ncbi:hypothetical protein V1514DRAFT_324236 [Lipomyces japonicus]|uniref:uncharacterized protein n=1 Tax=Lipomyces japonicus TaxID=56871 RepID=UPI0034CE3A6D
MSPHHSKSCSTSSSRRSWINHANHPSIPEHEEVTTMQNLAQISVSNNKSQRQESDYDDSVDSLVSSWLNTSISVSTSQTDAVKPQQSGSEFSDPLISDCDTKSEVSILSVATSTSDDRFEFTKDTTKPTGAHGLKSQVKWNNKTVILNLPNKTERFKKDFYKADGAKNLNNNSKESIVESNSRHLRVDSAAIFPDNLDNKGKPYVTIPNDKEWEQHVISLREQKLLSLGVSSPASEYTASPQSSHSFTPDINRIISGFNNFGIYSPSSPGYYQPVFAPSTPVSARAPSFSPQINQTYDEMATSGLKITYPSASHLDAAFNFSSPMPVTNPEDRMPKLSPGHQQMFSDYGPPSESADIIRAPKESKRIPIINPSTKLASPVPNQESFKKPRTDKEFTPLVQNGSTARKLSKYELDGIVKQISENTISNTDLVDDKEVEQHEDDSDSVWSDTVVKAQKERLSLQVAKQNVALDDAILQGLVTEALTKKLDPLEKLMTHLADQLKNRTDNKSDADDEDDDEDKNKNDLAHALLLSSNASAGASHSRATTRSVSRTVSVSDDATAEINRLRAELEEARHARERADILVGDLTKQLMDAGVAKGQLENYSREVLELKEKIAKDIKRYETEISREQEFSSMQKDQIKLLQGQITLLDEKIKMASSSSEESVNLKEQIILSHKEKEDIVHRHATEMAWLKSFLDSRSTELDQQAKLLSLSDSGSINRVSLEELYNLHNSNFVSKLKYGSALSLVSGEFVQMLTDISGALASRGITSNVREHRRKLSYVNENVAPLGEHHSNVIHSFGNSRGISGGLKDFKLSRAKTVHSSSIAKDEFKVGIRRPFRDI